MFFRNLQYHHLNVPHHLNQLFGFGDERKPADWDPMNKAGLVDTHIRKEVEFESLNTITSDIYRKCFQVNKLWKGV